MLYYYLHYFNIILILERDVEAGLLVRLAEGSLFPIPLGALTCGGGGYGTDAGGREVCVSVSRSCVSCLCTNLRLDKNCSRFLYSYVTLNMFFLLSITYQ